jgi:hypothetical protein
MGEIIEFDDITIEKNYSEIYDDVHKEYEKVKLDYEYEIQEVLEKAKNKVITLNLEKKKIFKKELEYIKDKYKIHNENSLKKEYNIDIDKDLTYITEEVIKRYSKENIEEVEDLEEKSKELPF